MMSDDRSRIRRLVLLGRALFAFAVLASAAVVVVFGFVVYLFIGGYSGGSNPESVAPVLIPIALAIAVFAGVPVVLICALAWGGYLTVDNRIHRNAR